ncbi:MAG: hypothetical protein J6386_18545 [Candidatus Synoicihabitans palmerolidicus]|nr:hypothetical protein [Candidatus Synoicihabitans palmerolidicus]
MARAVTGAADAFGARLELEISRSLVTHNRQSGGRDPVQIVLTGGGAQVPGLARRLEEKLGLPVSMLSFGQELEVSAATRLAMEEQGAQTLSGDLVGGAWAGLSMQSGINLLPQDWGAEREAKSRRPRWMWAAGMVVVATALPGVHYARWATARTEAAAAWGRQMTPHYAWQEEIRSNWDRQETLREELSTLNELVTAREAWEGLLADLQARMTTVEDVWFERMQVLPKKGNAERVQAGRQAMRGMGAWIDDGEDRTVKAEPLQLRVSGRLLDRENPLSRVSQSSYERATTLLSRLVESPYVMETEGERFDAGDPGILRFDFTLVLNLERGL